MLSVHFIDVGQGDSMLIKAGNQSMLIDGGPTTEGQTVTSYLKSQGVQTIDILVSTHPHEDHIGGLLTVLNEFPVKQVIDSGQVHTTQTYENYLMLIDQKDIPYSVGERGQAINLSSNVKIEILSPPSSMYESDLNQNSIVLRVTYGNVKFLFMGDAGFTAEDGLMSSGYDLKSDVLKVAHHGSKYSTSAAFLSQVRPAISVIEVGQNAYGHPAPETLALLQDAGTKIYRTDINGNITVTTDGTVYTVTTQYPSQVSIQKDLSIDIFQVITDPPRLYS
jgi:competence protein ComEC